MSERRLRVDVSMVLRSSGPPGLPARGTPAVWTVQFYEGGGDFSVARGTGETCIRALGAAIENAPPSHREDCIVSWQAFIAENPWFTYAPVTP